MDFDMDAHHVALTGLEASDVSMMPVRKCSGLRSLHKGLMNLTTYARSNWKARHNPSGILQSSQADGQCLHQAGGNDTGSALNNQKTQLLRVKAASELRKVS